MSLWMTPFILLWAVLDWLRAVLEQLAPVIGIAIGVACIAAAMLSVVVIIVVWRASDRVVRPWLRVAANALVVVEVVAAIAFAAIGAIAFAAVAILA